MIAVLAGHPSIDRLYEVPAIRKGDIHRLALSQTHVVAGGKGLNVARAIGNLGASAHVLGIVGGHAGRWVQSALADEGIKGTFVWTDAETRTSISVAATEDESGASTDFYETSPPVAASVWADLETAVTRVVPQATLLCLSGSAIPGAPLDCYRRMTAIAHQAGIPVTVDSRDPHLSETLRAQPDLIKVNVQEAAAALKRSAPEAEVLDWAAQAAAELRDRSGDRTSCAITCGPAGIVLVDRSGALLRGQLEAVGNYPVGSGDAVLGAFAVAMVSGMSSREALALALAAGAANAELPGPGVLRCGRARALAAQASIECKETWAD